jgi:hypothetical protein
VIRHPTINRIDRCPAKKMVGCAMTAREQRPIFIIRLRADSGVADPVRALRQALKVLLRRFGLRCVDVREEATE